MEFRQPARPSHQVHQPHQQHMAQQGPVSARYGLGSHLLWFLKRRWWLILLVLAVVGLGILSYGYVQTKNELTKLKNPSTSGKTETQILIDKIGKLVELPSGEPPTLATVKDVSKLK